MRLWQRVALVVGLVSVVSLLISGSFAVWVAGRSATTTADLAQERDVLAVAATVDRWLHEQTASLTGWALAFDLAELDVVRRDGLTRAILAAMPSTRVVMLLDADGQPLGTPASLAPLPPSQLSSLIDSLPVTEALGRSEGMAFGTPRTNVVPVVVLASRDPLLMVAAELELEIAADFAARTSDQHAVVLIDTAGVPILNGDAALLDLRRWRPLLGNVTRGVSYQIGEARARGASAPVRRTGWTVVMLESEDLALDGANRIRRNLPIVVAVTMLLAVLMGLVLAQSVTEPIARLRDSALSLAEGRFGTTTEINRADEVGELARAFDHLSRNLAENQREIHRQRSEIEAFNHELQDRVDAATSDLRQAQAQLVRAGQLAAVAQMGAGMAHELNNPLTAVLGLAQLLRARSPDPDLELLEREALRCRGVVDAMVRMTDADEVGPVALQQVMRDCVGAVMAGGHRVSVTLGDVPSVDLDAGPGAALRALSQLLRALVSGLPTGETLHVDAVQHGGFVLLRFAPSDAVGIERDDWMASGLDLWVARQSLDQLGADLVEPLDHQAPWQVRWAVVIQTPSELGSS